jgi:hypothetical protein
MGAVKLLFAGALFAFLASCTSYRIHLKVLPEDTYNVVLNDAVDKGATESNGQKDLSLINVSLGSSPKISVSNARDSGYVVLDGYIPMLASKNVDSLSVVNGPNGDRVYDIRFNMTSVVLQEKQPAKQGETDQAPAVARENQPPESAQGVQHPQKAGSETVEISEESPVVKGRPGRYLDPTRTPEYARKIATTGAACYFVGMGLNYITPFLSAALLNTRDTGSMLGGALLVLAIGAASGALQVAGTSYAAGGAALAWELGQGKCDASKEHPLSVWTFYKGGWVFMALGGAYDLVTSFVPVHDQGTALTLSVISLGLMIGKDIFWSITNAKALTMTRHVKECLEEQKTPAHHLKLELDPYATRGGAGLRCSLLF